MSRFVLALLLALATLAVFARVVGFELLNYDDPLYVTANPHVQEGLTVAGVGWAFTTFTAANWHPLTWISLMLDASIGGIDPRVFHLTNVVLHLANVLLLFLLLDRLTGSPYRSAVTAALFAIHPLHVESVAWVAERKDVLSTLFLLLTLLAYAGFVERPGPVRRLGVVLMFALGLLAKPMLVTLPVLLLLLDAWPLRRKEPWRRLVLEKAPLFAMSIATGVVTIVAQRHAETVGSLAGYPLGVRVANAIVATVTYLGQTMWPTRLAVFYPHPGASLAAWKVIVSSAILAALTFGAIRFRRSRPYLLIGWAWYLVTLAPVAGIVQVGWQARADRYTYIPLIGIFLAAVWAISDRIGERPAFLASLATAVVVLLGIGAFVQTGHWRDSETLFRHALAVTDDNAVAHLNLGTALLRRHQLAEAEEHFTEAVRINPAFAEAHSNLGVALGRQGRTDEAILEFRRALELQPDYPDARRNLDLAESLKRRAGAKP
ncbi:MAG TPA: tetratricopeptide repeat protein [Verrucomicrobiae bacterium]|nr:tetratricopeptide repeat protein [Verrucomicrobiae bacterium]